MSVGAMYPVRVDATLDPHLSRWLWLLKWLLAIPHYVLLFFLWLAFFAVSIVSFFAILFTGRFPPALFEFNVGVLRWSWRVAYYSYGALGTDRYPPFTLAEAPDYPAHLEVAYPQHLSRGLVLVKWWLLAIPHYLVVGLFMGGGAWAAWEADRTSASWSGGGLIGLLVLIAAIVLAITGRYPQPLYDFVLGLNRWVLRVAAYASLMTDDYPPFRLDMGGHEGGGTMTLPSSTGEGGPGTGVLLVPPAGGPVAPGASPVAPSTEPTGATVAEPPPGGPVPGPPPPPPAGPGPVSSAAGRRPSGWTAGRVVSLVIGLLLALVSAGVLTGGGAVTWLDHTQRDAAGYLTTNSHVFATSSYALTSDKIDLGSSDVVTPAALLGTVRIRATASDPTRPVFIGIGARSAVDGYLAGVSHVVVTNWSSGTTTYQQQAGGAPATAPTEMDFWSASTSGTGTQSLTWKPTGGEWVVVVMNPDGAQGVSVTADVGATLPDLGWIGIGLLAGGAVLLVGAVLLITLPIARASRRRPSSTPHEVA